MGDDALSAAAATGCNPGGHARWKRLPVKLAEQAGIPMFTLIEEPGATAAVDALRAAKRSGK